MKIKFFFFSLLFISITTFANDRFFTYIYQSNVLEKKQKEIEVWNTFRFKKETFFRAFEPRIEFEIGIGKNTQTAFYLNIGHSATAIPNGSEPELEKETEFSFSNEWKHQFSNPVAQKLGSALYGELTIGLNEIELEGKLILDKQVKKWLFVHNSVFEYEIEKAPSYSNGNLKMKRNHEFKLDFNFGVCYFLNKGFTVGLEAVQKNVFTPTEKLEHSAIYFGPNASWRMDNFWITATILPQIAGFKGNAYDRKLNLTEFERLQTRLIFSYAF